ncbi:ABC transporter substrate-binding protein [Jiangella aurantiaca]|uniref:ABC transporter substrate-binding protein n=1 Tax=Jiangella aurantiaca TaxID=2530373 RepID=UPI0013A5CA11|nr:extracellular solute-binding protein [Jiangella aurantiaca]
MNAPARWLAGGGAALVLTIAACGTPGSSSEDDGPARVEGEEITAPVTADEVAELGDVTLRVLADAGEESTLTELIPEYEELYPNVTVEVEYRSYDDIVRTEANTLSGGDPPDLAQGAQGYALDGALVEAGLIRPLDDLAEAYEWFDRYGESTLGEFRWSDDGTRFGTGSIYGISPVVSMVGVYYNKAKLDALGLELPHTFADFEAALATAQAAGEQPIMFGNALKSTGLHIFGVVQGQNVDPAVTRDWISGTDGATFDTPENVATATTIQEWAQQGYFGEGYNGLAEDDAVARFAAGEGVFLIGGTWQMAAIQAGGGDFGFFPMPPGESGLHVASGSLGMGWHVSTESEVVPAAAAFIGLITSDEWAQKLADLGRVPVLAQQIDASEPLFADAVAGSGTILADGGNTYSFDWATGTMMASMGGALQELMDGRLTPQEFVTPIQDDWAAFQAER